MELFSFLVYYMVVFSWVLFIMYRAFFGVFFQFIHGSLRGLFSSYIGLILGAQCVVFRALFEAPMYDTEGFFFFPFFNKLYIEGSFRGHVP